MDYSIGLVKQLAIPTLSLRRHSSVQNLPVLLSQAFGEIIQYASTQGVDITGPAFVIYYNMDMNNLDIEIGFVTLEPVKGNEDIRNSKIPAGKYVIAEHIGPYTEMPPLYDAMSAFMIEKEVYPTGIAYEFYYNSPMEVPESQLKTKVMLGCFG